MKNNLRSQAGMTLIELTVVLLILVGLAGLMLPYVGGFMAKTHNSTTVSTIADLNRVIAGYTTSKAGLLPSNLETLTSVSGGVDQTSAPNHVTTTANGVYALLQSNGTNNFLGALTAGTGLSAAQTSLAGAGIGTVWDMNATTTDATFKSTGNPLAISATTSLAHLIGSGASNTFYNALPANMLTADAVRNQLLYAFGGTPGDTTTSTCQTPASTIMGVPGTCASTWDTACTNYIVMGIGAANSMVPTYMANAPVHFAGTGPQAPALQYNRYSAVFAVPNGTCDNTGSPATFVGSAMIMPFPAIVGIAGAQEYAGENLQD